MISEMVGCTSCLNTCSPECFVGAHKTKDEWTCWSFISLSSSTEETERWVVRAVYIVGKVFFVLDDIIQTKMLPRLHIHRDISS